MTTNDIYPKIHIYDICVKIATTLYFKIFELSQDRDINTGILNITLIRLKCKDQLNTQTFSSKWRKTSFFNIALKLKIHFKRHINMRHTILN